MKYEADEVLAGIAEITGEEAGIPAEQITRATRFADDLDIDSIGLLTIATQVEERFGPAIPDDVIPTLTTVGDIVDLVSADGAADPDSGQVGDADTAATQA